MISAPTGLLGQGTHDEHLALALVEGRTGAALRAWRRFNPLVLRTLRRMLGPGVDIQDMAQDVFLRFFCKYRPEEAGPLRALLSHAVRRRRKDQAARTRRALSRTSIR